MSVASIGGIGGVDDVGKLNRHVQSEVDKIMAAYNAGTLSQQDAINQLYALKVPGPTSPKKDSHVEDSQEADFGYIDSALVRLGVRIAIQPDFI